MSTSVTVADWPQHRGNAQRSAFVEQPLSAEAWQPAWSQNSLAAPDPAWPKPARGSLWQNLTYIAPRVTDDRGDVPLLARDRAGELHVLVASSGNDCLLCLDPTSGQLQWRYDTQAPLRYAPTVVDGVAYGGGDDGLVFALDVATGQIIWREQIGPELPWIIGNGRLISPHPIRTSVLVRDGLVYAHAGLFPSQGVYAVALSAADGELVWRRKIDRSPQGYLLSGDSRVIVPAGRATPYAIDAESGQMLGDLPAESGTFCMLTPEALFTGPGNAGAVQVKAQGSNAQLLSFNGQAVAAGGGRIWSANGKQLTCYTMQEVNGQQQTQEAWAVPCSVSEFLIASGQDDHLRVFVAGGGQIAIHDGATGRQLQTLQLPRRSEQLVYLAVSSADDGDLLLASSRSGRLYAWRATPSADSQAGQWPAAADPQQPEPQTAQVQSPEVPTSRVDVQPYLASLKSPKGYALVLDDTEGHVLEALLKESELTVVGVVPTADAQLALRERFMRQQDYGQRVTVWHVPEDEPLPFAETLFNLVLSVNDESELRQQEAWRVLADAGGVSGELASQSLRIKPSKTGAGSWRHQYASPENRADSEDAIVGRAREFRLQWFGGVGPSRMPDRHLRGPAPLVAGGAMIMNGDGKLIGVDPANGTERWELDLPSQAMRYVMPYDAGWSALTADGEQLFVSAAAEIWQVDAYRGQIQNRIPLPPLPQSQDAAFQWGYLSEVDGSLFATCMKQSARRFSQDRTFLRQSFTSDDYNSSRPLVCSRVFLRMTPAGESKWRYDAEGVIVHGSISVSTASQRVVFIEGRSEACREHESDRVHVKTLLEDGYVVCLDSDSGQKVWELPLQWEAADNMLFTQIAGDVVPLVTSRSLGDKAEYHTRVLRLADGSLLWETHHSHVRAGLFHGEQVHHPVVLRRDDETELLVVEPYLYELRTGERSVPPGQAADWALNRPGHSCGTLSGAGHCLFFRANNPTVLNLSKDQNEQPFTKLSPSRPSCWINIIPATGRLLIPEGSASCVCNYSLQTSMAFVPLLPGESDEGLPLLEDVLNIEVAEEELKLLHDWRFDSANATQKVVKPEVGELTLQAVEPLNVTERGVEFDGKQWLTIDPQQAELPASVQARTISLAADVVIDAGNPEWTALVGALQDNGTYERGWMLGIHNERFFFAISSAATGRLTYLTAGSKIKFGERQRVAGTYDGNVMKLFIDGQLAAVSSEQQGPVLYEPQSWLALGIYKDDNDAYPLKGSLRRVQIYQGHLSDAEVNELFNED